MCLAEAAREVDLYLTTILRGVSVQEVEVEPEVVMAVVMGFVQLLPDHRQLQLVIAQILLRELNIMQPITAGGVAIVNLQSVSAKTNCRGNNSVYKGVSNNFWHTLVVVSK